MAESATNIGVFVKSVKTEIELAGFKQFKVFKKTVAKKALEKLVSRTPIITGRLKGNWVVGVNSIPTTVDVKRFDKNGAETIALGKASIDSSAGIFDDITIINNIHYLQYVHNGTAGISANPFILGVAEELGLEFIGS